MATFDIDEKRFNIIKEAVSSGPAAQLLTRLSAIYKAILQCF